MELLQNYPNPEPVGLFDAITAAGHHVWTYDDQRYADDAAAVQSIIDSYTLKQAKASVSAKIAAVATSCFNKAIEGYSPGELAGWPILRAEALAYNADANASIPNITAEAAARGCDVPPLVQKVLANSAYFNNLRAQIAGVSGKHRDAVGALNDMLAVANYDYSTGWPGV